MVTRAEPRPQGGRDAALTDRLAAVAEPIVVEAGAELVEVDVRGEGGRRLVRVTVDTEAGVDVDTCATLSSRLGPLFEAAIDGRFTLEVTSPGVRRPLRTPRDFRRNIGRTVRVRRIDETREIVGIVRAVEDDAVTLEVDGDGDDVRVGLATIDDARVVLPW